MRTLQLKSFRCPPHRGGYAALFNQLTTSCSLAGASLILVALLLQMKPFEESETLLMKLSKTEFCIIKTPSFSLSVFTFLSWHFLRNILQTSSVPWDSALLPAALQEWSCGVCNTTEACTWVVCNKKNHYLAHWKACNGHAVMLVTSSLAEWIWFKNHGNGSSLKCYWKRDRCHSCCVQGESSSHSKHLQEMPRLRKRWGGEGVHKLEPNLGAPVLLRHQ